MRFPIDAQLPPALTVALREQGHQADHLADVGLRSASDAAIWDFALQNDAVILTKDEDFVERFRRNPAGPVIVWLRLGNAATRVLLAWFLPLLRLVVSRIEAGDRLIEMRRES